MNKHSARSKGSAVHKKSAKKQEQNHGRLFLISRIPNTRKGIIKLALVTIVLIAIAGSIPVPYSFAKTVPLPFNVNEQVSVGLELGDTKVLLEGTEGSKRVEMKSLQSLWGKLLGLQPIGQKESNSTTIETPVDKIVAIGSRKYQYMLCTNGNYRYYTDEQFKDPKTGFTSKSEDNCKENNQGVKLTLADSPDGSVKNQAASNTAVNTSVPVGCKNTPTPIKTEYLNVSYLPRGTQQVSSEGVSGFILSCPGSKNTVVSGVSRLVLVGTGKTAEEIQAENDAAEVARQQEKVARDQRYNLALANCIQSLKAQGMQQSSAESNCRSIVKW